MGSDFEGLEAIIFQRLKGGSLTSSRDGLVGQEIPPMTRPFTVIRLRDWIGLRTSGGHTVFYEVRPR